MAARYEYRIRRLGLAGKYRIGLNAVRTGKIGVKGLVVEYGEYPSVFGEYSPTQQQSPTTLKAALEAAWSTHTPLDFTKVMQDLLTWERNGRSDDKAAAAKRYQLRVASNTTRATGKQGGGASNTGALSNTGTGSSGGGVASGSGRTTSTKSTSSTVQQGKSTSATRGICISELLAVLRLGSPCRAAIGTCKYTHVTDFTEAMQLMTKTKGEMKDYLSNHNIVKQRMRSDPAWTNTFTMKLASL